MAGWITKRWAIDCCKQFFGLTDEDEWLIGKSGEGPHFLRSLYAHDPAHFYEHPLQLLRQEWFHTYRQTGYAHPGFWLALAQDAVVFDYGCGTGEVTRLPWLASGGDTVLVEGSETCLTYLTHKFRQYPGAILFAANADWREYAPFEALVCTDMLEHVSEPMALMMDLWACLKPGGHALLRFDTIFPHPGHLEASIAQFPQWKDWLKAETEVIEVERYAWVRKPL